MDLFSGAGGMSYGFHAHPDFQVAGAVDAQLGKPSSGRGTLGCNVSYLANIGLEPVEADLATADPEAVCAKRWACAAGQVDRAGRVPAVHRVLPDAWPAITCATTCATAWSAGSAGSPEVLRPDIVLLENARELVMGRFSGHLRGLLADLDRAGLPTRPRTPTCSTASACRSGASGRWWWPRAAPLPLRDLTDSVGRLAGQPQGHPRAAGDLGAAAGPSRAPPTPPMTCTSSPALSAEANRRRLAAIPHDGGSWADLIGHPDAGALLTPAMRRRAAAGDLGSHPDVYGRLWWDRPAVTIKRECGHIGNGRYAHPEQDRLCTVREMAILQGFPRGYRFAGSLSNMYRHIGDAVPPLISYQLAAACRWMLTGERPEPADLMLPGCHLHEADVERGRPSSRVAHCLAWEQLALSRPGISTGLAPPWPVVSISGKRAGARRVR